MLYEIGRILVPLLIQTLAGMLVNMYLGRYLGAAWLSLITAAILLPVFVYMYRRECEKEWKKRAPVWYYGVALVTGILSNFLISFGMMEFGIIGTFSNEVQEGLLASDMAAQILGLCLVIPVMEELLFRGLIYRRLREKQDILPAVILTAGLFALYHGNVIQMISASLMGTVLCLAYEKTRSLSIPIVLHIAFNAYAVLQHVPFPG